MRWQFWLYGLDESQHQSASLSHPGVHQELQQKVSPEVGVLEI